MKPRVVDVLSNICNTLLSAEQCSQFDRLRLQHIQMLNRTSSFKTEIRLAALTIMPSECLLSHVPDSRLPITNYCSANYGQRSWHSSFKKLAVVSYILAESGGWTELLG